MTQKLPLTTLAVALASVLVLSACNRDDDTAPRVGTVELRPGRGAVGGGVRGTVHACDGATAAALVERRPQGRCERRRHPGG